MPKFTLIGEHTDLQGNPDGSKMTYEFHCDYLPEVLEHFELFIRGCGFVPDGTLDFVKDEPYYGLDPDFGDHGGGSLPEDYPELYESQDIPGPKSNFYFDTERNK
jgi:hypothetical protein